jgi:hypothetical protein
MTTLLNRVGLYLGGVGSLGDEELGTSRSTNVVSDEDT